jgi:hypothetical protein
MTELNPSRFALSAATIDPAPLPMMTTSTTSFHSLIDRALAFDYGYHRKIAWLQPALMGAEAAIRIANAAVRIMSRSGHRKSHRSPLTRAFTHRNHIHMLANGIVNQK